MYMKYTKPSLKTNQVHTQVRVSTLYYSNFSRTDKSVHIPKSLEGIYGLTIDVLQKVISGFKTVSFHDSAKEQWIHWLYTIIDSKYSLNNLWIKSNKHELIVCVFTPYHTYTVLSETQSCSTTKFNYRQQNFVVKKMFWKDVNSNLEVKSTCLIRLCTLYFQKLQPDTIQFWKY
jgi:hypothetical protein